MDARLQAQLDPIVRLERRVKLFRALAACWGSAAVGLLLLILAYYFTGWFSSALVVALLATVGVVALVASRRIRSSTPDYLQLARRIETEHPELNALLLAAIEQRPEPGAENLSFLQKRVVRQAVQHGQKHDWGHTQAERLLFAQSAQWVAIAVLLLALFGIEKLTPGTTGSGAALIGGLSVTPGDTSLERGSSLVVLARFPGRLPSQATLVVQSAKDEPRRIPLVKNLDDPVFGGTIPEVSGDLLYRVEYDNKGTREFKVTVFDFPALVKADAHLDFPEYTGLPDKTIEDTRQFSAVEGTQLDYVLHLNKPVASAQLVARDKTVIPLTTDAAQGNQARAAFKLEKSDRYELRLVDHEGRTNKIPARFDIAVLTNRAPELKFAFPRGDQRVSPIQEMSFQAEAWDDFGLKSYGLAYAVPGEEPSFIELGGAAAAQQKQKLSHLLALEQLGMEPNQLVSYFLWADDIGPDGQVRRTASDLFFAEVRPLEEIFREAQAPSGGESQQGEGQESPASRLAEMQKEIITATWNIKRRSSGSILSTNTSGSKTAKLPPNYKKDVETVREAQEKGLDMLQEMQARSEDPQVTQLVTQVEDEMNKAVEHLRRAEDKPAELSPAVKAEQAAYQALLKLQAREYSVSRNRNQRGGGRGGSANQRQLDQLELKQEEDRYETQSQANPQMSAEQREQLQVLNRLKELARRQQDLNERLKELQTALQEARTEAEREELRKQLKRLREEEREMLADVDELRQRMDQPQNQSRMAESRQQLEESREQIQQAAQALEQDQVAQALSSGTRAQRELQQLRDDFRKETSNQFAEDMRQMRQQARQLAEKQEEIGKNLESIADPKRKSLSNSAEAQQVAEQLQQQKSTMTNVLEQIRQVSEQSEIAEPLLSSQLYDTLRQANQNEAKNLETLRRELEESGMLTRSINQMIKDPDAQTGERSVDVLNELLRQNFLPQAGRTEERMRQSVNELKERVEHAAGSVLGDDTEALRLAKRELDELTRQLEQEIAQADPNQRTNSQSALQSGQESGGQQGNDPNQASGQNPQELAGNQSGDSQTQGNRPGSRESNPSGEANSREGNQPGQSTQSGQRQGQGQASRENQNEAQGNREGQANGGQGQRPGQQASGQRGERNQEQANANSPQGQNQQGQNQQGQNQGNRGNQGQGGGERQGNSPGQNPGQQNAGDGQGELARRGGQSGPSGPRGGGDGNERLGPLRQLLEGGGPGGNSGPLTGPEFSEWSDRLREVEEMIEIPELRAEVARVRDRARAVRAEFKRHSKEPQWGLVRMEIAGPLVEVRNRVIEELARRESSDSLVPIDRDPVPRKFSELVREYYEKLSSAPVTEKK